MAYGETPFGLADVKLTTIDGATQVDLPNGRVMTFKESITSNTLRGDDRIVSIVAIADGLEWSLEAGGISLAAWALMTGRTAVVAGSSPNETTTITGSAGEDYPYFKIYGKSVSDDAASDIHVKVFKAKLNAPLEGTFGDGEFFVTACSGVAIDDGSNGIYEIVQNETAAALPAT
jgi:hypothetical protein